MGLTAADANFAKFKLRTKIACDDGSSVTWQTTSTRGDNSTGTVANMVLAA